MAKYLPRKCPRCSDYFGVVINQPRRRGRVLPIHAFCDVCGYNLDRWRLVIGRGVFRNPPPVRNNLRTVQ